MSVRVIAVGRPDLPPFEMPDRFRHDITYFVTAAGERGAPADLREGEWWVRGEEARELLADGVIRIVSPLDSRTTAELEISEDQESWLVWMVENQIERVILGMIEWVFIDLGNALFNDDPQNFHGYRIVYEAIADVEPEYSFADILAEREGMASAGLNWVLHRIAKKHLTPEQTEALFKRVRSTLKDEYDDNNVVNEGAVPLLEDLRSERRLGVIANQSPEARRSLERRGLLPYFDVVAISDELNLHKPDVRLYEWALKRAACDAAKSVMIGDRRDNDIVPANALGMRTILLRWPSARSKGWNPRDPMAQAFLDSCDRVPLFSAVPVGPDPDRTASSLLEIAAALRSIDD